MILHVIPGLLRHPSIAVCVFWLVCSICGFISRMVFPVLISFMMNILASSSIWFAASPMPLCSFMMRVISCSIVSIGCIGLLKSYGCVVLYRNLCGM